MAEWQRNSVGCSLRMLLCAYNPAECAIASCQKADHMYRPLSTFVIFRLTEVCCHSTNLLGLPNGAVRGGVFCARNLGLLGGVVTPWEGGMIRVVVTPCAGTHSLQAGNNSKELPGEIVVPVF